MTARKLREKIVRRRISVVEEISVAVCKRELSHSEALNRQLRGVQDQAESNLSTLV